MYKACIQLIDKFLCILVIDSNITKNFNLHVLQFIFVTSTCMYFCLRFIRLKNSLIQNSHLMFNNSVSKTFSSSQKRAITILSREIAIERSPNSNFNLITNCELKQSDAHVYRKKKQIITHGFMLPNKRTFNFHRYWFSNWL